MPSAEKYTLTQNYASFTTFLTISSCITSCTTSELSSFTSKLCKKLDQFDLDPSSYLLKSFKRHLVAFIYENIYCDGIDEIV